MTFAPYANAPHSSNGLAHSPSARCPIDERQWRAEVIPLSKVVATEMEWLWPERIPEGKLVLIAGDPGVGKSMLTLYIARQISTGEGWADSPEIKRTPGRVMLLNEEDDWANVVKPRLKAMGANIGNIDTLPHLKRQGVHGEETRPIDLSSDWELLRNEIMARPDLKLVIIDPLACFSGRVNQDNNAEVRQLLAPLAAMAEEFKVTIIVVTHLNKQVGRKATERVMGSGGLVAGSRSVWTVAKDRDDPARRIFAPVKMNYGPDDVAISLAYTIVEQDGVGIVSWLDEPVSISADELLGAESRSPGRPDDRLQHAKAFLQRILANGPCEAKRMEEERKQAAVSESTLKRAKRQLGIVSRQFGGHSYWCLPDQVPGGLPPGGHISQQTNDELPW